MHSRKQIGSGILALAIGLVFAMGSLGCAADKKEASVKFADCPAAVQKTMTEQAAGVQFTEVEKETKKDGTVVFEAKGKKADGKEIKIKVAGDGTLIEMKNKD